MENVKKKKHSKMGEGKGTKAIVWTLFAFLLLYVALMAFALGWALNTSLKGDTDFRKCQNIFGLPSLSGLNQYGRYQEKIKLESLTALKFGNYKFVLDKFQMNDTTASYFVWFGSKQRPSVIVDSKIPEMLLNSIIYSLGNSVIQVIALTLMGYLCAKYDYRFSRFLYVMVIVLMSLPIVGAYPGEITLLRNLNLYDTWYGNAMQKFGFIGMYFLVFYEYFKGTPDVYRDAAEIDGASQWAVMLQIYVPMAMKTIGSVILVRFVFHWNDYSSIRMYMPSHPTLSYGVFMILIGKPTQGVRDRIPIQMAANMMLAVPIIIIFVCFQEKIMGSMTLGGIKE